MKEQQVSKLSLSHVSNVRKCLNDPFLTNMFINLWFMQTFSSNISIRPIITCRTSINEMIRIF